MMDNVSVERNVDMVGEIITSINTVILHDVSLSSESWARLSQHWSDRSKNLVTLELFQLLSVTEDSIRHIVQVIIMTKHVKITSAGNIGLDQSHCTNSSQIIFQPQAVSCLLCPVVWSLTPEYYQLWS